MRKISIIIFLILTISLSVNGFITAFSADREAVITDSIAEFCAGTKCSEVSVAVVWGDKTEIYGNAEGLYQIGSMTKAFTGLAILKMKSDGLLSENDKVSEFLPGFTACFENEFCEITIGQLLTQTSGYTNNETEYPGAAEDMSLMEWADSISGKELWKRPGSEYAYSNVNYNLLGAVIERVSGRSYEEYMVTEILIPLGLMNTFVKMPDDHERIIHGSRLGYRHSFEYEIPVAPGRIPAGYFYSNAADMARWIQIWIGTADIPEDYKLLVNAVKKIVIAQEEYYSGWELFEHGIIGHSGGTPNYSSRLVFSDREQIGVCVLANLNVSASTDGLCNGIFSSCTGEPVGKLQTDIWTVFDLIFTAVTGIGFLLLILPFRSKRRGILVAAEILLIIVLASICAVMPFVFGAGLGAILFVWAPYSLLGGISILAVDLCVIAIRLGIMRKNEN